MLQNPTTYFVRRVIVLSIGISPSLPHTELAFKWIEFTNGLLQTVMIINTMMHSDHVLYNNTIILTPSLAGRSYRNVSVWLRYHCYANHKWNRYAQPAGSSFSWDIFGSFTMYVPHKTAFFQLFPRPPSSIVFQLPFPSVYYRCMLCESEEEWQESRTTFRTKCW